MAKAKAEYSTTIEALEGALETIIEVQDDVVALVNPDRRLKVAREVLAEYMQGVVEDLSNISDRLTEAQLVFEGGETKAAPKKAAKKAPAKKGKTTTVSEGRTTKSSVGRTPQGNLRNFAQMSTSKFADVYADVLEAGDADAVAAVKVEAASRNTDKPQAKQAQVKGGAAKSGKNGAESGGNGRSKGGAAKVQGGNGAGPKVEVPA